MFILFIYKHNNRNPVQRKRVTKIHSHQPCFQTVSLGCFSCYRVFCFSLLGHKAEQQGALQALAGDGDGEIQQKQTTTFQPNKTATVSKLNYKRRKDQFNNILQELLSHVFLFLLPVSRFHRLITELLLQGKPLSQCPGRRDTRVRCQFTSK